MLNNDFTTIFKIVKTTFILVFIIIFFVVIFSVTKTLKKTREINLGSGNYDKNLINKEFLLKDLSYKQSIIYNLFVLAFVTVFGAFFMYGIYQSTKDTDASLSIKLFMFAFSGGILGIFFFISIKSIYKSLQMRSLILNGDFIVTVDELSDMDTETYRSNDNTHTNYYLFFKNIYKNYGRKILTSYSTYSISSPKDDFIILYLSKCDRFMVYNEREASLDYDLRSKQIDIESFGQYYNGKSKTPYVNKTPKAKKIDSYLNTIQLHNEEIANLYKRRSSMSLPVFMIVLLSLSLFYFLDFVAFKENITIGIFIFAFVTLFLVAFSIGFINEMKLIKLIKNGEYYFKSDLVLRDETDEHFKDSGLKKYYKMKDFPDIIKVDVNGFEEVSTGDELYIFFLNNENLTPSFKENNQTTVPDMSNIYNQTLDPNASFYESISKNMTYKPQKGAPFLIINPNVTHLSNEVLEKQRY